MNTNTRTVSVHDTLFGRQANNLDVEQLSAAVKPWFSDMSDSAIAKAIEELKVPELRNRAARYLGLKVIPVA
ncbi:hypothetical protein G7Y41_05095 [Schaalia sp. ZJ405]|uniref:hypothetical protein n=1 Tax=Schaalia sp. ZJ405 TaxID=2709403 RepID=UPI0013EC7D37|nr:hypothetical protein [Schaalia sp. ZJ405]QPK80497.1 hypothetical protein G7Y41_05095 [Schaalia sp. ZJ405]